MNWLFYVFMATIIFHLIGTIALVTDIGEHYPEFYKRLNGYGVFFSPFKQLDLILWIVTRRYIANTDRVFHRYDLYLANLILALVFGLAAAAFN